MLAVSCIFDDPASFADMDETYTYSLNLQVVSPCSDLPFAAGASGTRSEGGVPEHGLQEGTDAESYINIDAGDYKILIFDENGNLVVNDFVPSVSQLYFSPTEPENLIYRFSGRVAIPQETKQIQVMMLANWKSFNSQANYSFNEKPALETIYRNGTSWNFGAPSGGWSGWRPSLADKRAIPMFGISKTVDLTEVTTLTDDNRVDVEQFPLIRSIAKIEIIDNISPEYETVIKMTGCTLSAYNTNGRYIPNVNENGDWNQPPKQVTAPSLPGAPGAATNLQFSKTTDSEGRTVYVAYLPEMGINDNNRPNITVQMTAWNGTSSFERNSSFSFNNYKDNVEQTGGNALAAVLRNHIYRYTVTFDTVTQLNLEYAICRWEEESVDIPEFD